MMDRLTNFPSGYFGCCGRSRARGHAEICHRAAQADTRRMAETGTGSGRSPSGTVGEADAPKTGG